MNIEEIWQLVPPVDKQLKNALKSMAKKAADMKTQNSMKQLRDSDKDGALIKKKPIKIRTKISNKKPEVVKPKMVDAWTQTERSDFAIIKYKMQKKLQAKSLEKNKLNMMLNSQSNTEGVHSVVRTTKESSESLSIKMSSTFKNSSSTSVKKHTPLTSSGMKHYSQIPLKMNLAKSVTRSGPESSKSQLTPGFSRNPIKAPSKRTMLQMGKKKKLNKMRLPSIQGSRDKKTRE